VFDSFELIKLLESLNHVLVVINRNLIHERKEQIGRVFDFPTQPCKIASSYLMSELKDMSTFYSNEKLQ
jgi:hypothetical protein